MTTRKTAPKTDAKEPKAKTTRSRKAAAPVDVAEELTAVAVEVAPVVDAAPIEPAPRVRVLPTREDIARRAHTFWRQGSRDTLGNWLRAEAELLG